MKKMVWCFLLVAIFLIVSNGHIQAANIPMLQNKAPSMHYVKVETKRSNNSYAVSEPIRNNDIHFGMEMGQFLITGYSHIEDDGKGNILILLGEDDKPSITFDLQRDIDDLTGDSKHHISNDTDGSDEVLGYRSPNGGFGRGALVYRFNDSTGRRIRQDVHRNYFLAMKSEQADKEIIPLEEGDWMFALDYEIETPGWMFGVNKYYDQYTIRFNVQVRSANCMAYIRDINTDHELKDNDWTYDGFFIDLANAKYLKVSVQQADLINGDIRWQGIYADGAMFTASGKYTVTVSNKYSGATVTKTIMVDTN